MSRGIIIRQLDPDDWEKFVMPIKICRALLISHSFTAGFTHDNTEQFCASKVCPAHSHACSKSITISDGIFACNRCCDYSWTKQLQWVYQNCQQGIQTKNNSTSTAFGRSTRNRIRLQKCASDVKIARVCLQITEYNGSVSVAARNWVIIHHSTVKWFAII